MFLSGDGGWADIDKKIGEVLAQRGIDVIGFDNRAYLRGKTRTPDGTGADVARAAAAYLARWNDQRLVLIGYSRGADLLPFVGGAAAGVAALAARARGDARPAGARELSGIGSPTSGRRTAARRTFPSGRSWSDCAART